MEDILNVFIFDDEEQNDDIEDTAILDIFRDGNLGSRAALYGLFNFENLENAKCFSMFRSKKEHIPRLASALGIPDAVNVNRVQFTGEKIQLPEEKEYTIGRKNCDILLENDQSISRTHAILRVKGNHVTLEDCESKYHTLYNGSELKPKIETALHHMDLIQFGILNSKFRFESYKFVVAASALSSDKKAQLKQNLTKCDGKYVDKWQNNCTHLTVDKLTLTTKVLQALVDEKPIVTVEYWEDYATSIQNKKPPPDINNYNKPPVAEQLLRSDFEYKFDGRRKTLFTNKLFIFLKSSTKKTMEDVIKSCGGSCISWEDEPKTLFDIKKSPLEHIIVQADNDEENVSFNAVIKDFDKQGKRLIPMNEIALAIIYCSCNINCNPCFNKVTKVFAPPTQTQRPRNVVALETETEHLFATPLGVKTERVIPPSVQDDWMMTTNTKENQNQRAEASGFKRSRKEQVEESLPKKFKLEDENKETSRQGEIKPIEVFQNSKTSTARDDPSKNTPHTYQKRKAVDEVNTACASKANPFNLIKPSTNKRSKVIEEENPFELTRSSKQPKILQKNDANPFANIPCLGIQNAPSVKIEKAKSKEEPKIEIKVIPTNKSVLGTNWISRSGVKIEAVIKEEDPQMAKIAEAFKDCVKLEVMPMYERTISSIPDISFESVDGKKNFKRFKKVQPLKPQVTIINRHQFKKIAPGDPTGIEVNDKNSEDEDCFGNSRIKEVVKPRGKRFIL